MRTIVTGLIGQYAFGGVTWDYIQYALGFRKLGKVVKKWSVPRFVAFREWPWCRKNGVEEVGG
jgi:hypothetical protein